MCCWNFAVFRNTFGNTVCRVVPQVLVRQETCTQSRCYGSSDKLAVRLGLERRGLGGGRIGSRPLESENSGAGVHTEQGKIRLRTNKCCSCDVKLCSSYCCGIWSFGVNCTKCQRWVWVRYIHSCIRAAQYVSKYLLTWYSHNKPVPYVLTRGGHWSNYLISLLQ